MGNSNGKPVVFTDSGTCFEVLCRRIVCSSADNYPLVNLNHFRLLRVVGKGAFGKVRIVERKDNGEQFALKYIRKDEGASISCKHRLKSVLTRSHSGTIRKRAKHNTRAANAGAPTASIFMQFTIQLSRH